MEPKAPPDSRAPEQPITQERLRNILDAYGANPDRWPPGERAGMLELLERSSAARRERDRAARLDAVLDRAPSAQPSAGLAARILATAPPERARTGSRPGRLRSTAQNRPRGTGSARGARLWRYAAAAAPLAAAAAVFAFLLIRPMEQTPRESMQLTIAELGAYETPTDVLLELPLFDLVSTVPTLGCEDSALGCPEIEFPDGTESSESIKSSIKRRILV